MNRHEALVEDSMFGEQSVTTGEEIEETPRLYRGWEGDRPPQNRDRVQRGADRLR